MAEDKAVNGTDTAPGLNYEKINLMVERLAQSLATPSPSASGISSADEQAKLRLDYQLTIETVKLLSDIRFRCIVFVTSIITIANAILPGSGDAGTRIALSVVGFLGTLGIAVYELRNSQLYEAAIHRAKNLEKILGMPASTSRTNVNGLFSERPDYVESARGAAWEANRKSVPPMRFFLIRVKHDHGLACIYSAALAGWAYLIAYGILFLPSPVNSDLWRALTVGEIRVLAAVIGVAVLVITFKRWIYHDNNRYRPSGPSGKA